MHPPRVQAPGRARRARSGRAPPRPRRADERAQLARRPGATVPAPGPLPAVGGLGRAAGPRPWRSTSRPPSAIAHLGTVGDPGLAQQRRRQPQPAAASDDEPPPGALPSSSTMRPSRMPHASDPRPPRRPGRGRRRSRSRPRTLASSPIRFSTAAAAGRVELAGRLVGEQQCRDGGRGPRTGRPAGARRPRGRRAAPDAIAQPRGVQQLAAPAGDARCARRRAARVAAQPPRAAGGRARAWSGVLAEQAHAIGAGSVPGPGLGARPMSRPSTATTPPTASVARR